MPSQAGIQDSTAKAIRIRQVAQNVIDGLAELQALQKSLQNGDFDFGSIDFSNVARVGNCDNSKMTACLNASDNILQSGDGNALRAVASKQV